MVVPFGVSVGEFIAGLTLLKASIEALSDARGARADYVALRCTLDALSTALDGASKSDTAVHRTAVENIL